RPADVARLTYTSGSTGQPKACAHTYEAMSLAYPSDRGAPVLRRLLAHFERCLIPMSLANPVMFSYLGRCLVAGEGAHPRRAGGTGGHRALPDHRHHDAPGPARPGHAVTGRSEQPARGADRWVTGWGAAAAGGDGAARADRVAGLRSG